MRLILTRHGETNENTKKISMGQGIDGLLNEEGKEQAKKLAKSLKQEKIDVIYASDLKRTIDTAKEILIYQPHAKIIPEPALRERNLGIYEGQPNNKWKEAMQESLLPFHEFQPSGGESYAELQNRTGFFFDSVISIHQNDTILLVSHTGTLTMLLLKILNIPITKENYNQYKSGNTAVTILEIITGKPTLVHLLNDTSHLEG